jgi:hypothetical protein
MRNTAHVIRSPQGDSLDAGTLATLRALLAEHGALRLSVMLGPSASALTRAASGCRVLRGTRELIRTGVERLRAKGELPSAGDER